MRRTPGDTLLHPVAIGAVIVLVFNDHHFKHEAPGWVTGKLSDIAGLVFFPLLLVALVELARKVGGMRDWVLPVNATLVAAGLTAVAFTLVKSVPLVASALSGAIGGRVLSDPTDLLALPVVLAAVAIERRVATPRDNG